MDEWEKQVAQVLKSERIELYHKNTSTTTNGRPTGAESYLQLDIYNSEVIKEIAHNKRLMSKKCDEIKDIVLNVPTLSQYPDFNELRLRIIETHGFFIFSSNKENTVTYRVR
jgi:hypothetical protein